MSRDTAVLNVPGIDEAMNRVLREEQQARVAVETCRERARMLLEHAQKTRAKLIESTHGRPHPFQYQWLADRALQRALQGLRSLCRALGARPGRRRGQRSTRRAIEVMLPRWSGRSRELPARLRLRAGPRAGAAYAELPRESELAASRRKTRSLSAFLRERRGPRRSKPWVAGLSGAATPTTSTRGVRALFPRGGRRRPRDGCRDGWRAAVRWMQWLPQLPASLAQGLGTGTAPDWIGARPVSSAPSRARG